jgi:hypothetical protein
MNDAIGRVTSILSIPYGYTVSLWAAGALTVRRLGTPSVLDVLLFVIGAVVAFVGLAAMGHDHLDAEVPMRVPSLVVVNLFPIGVALLVVAFPAQMVGRPLGYFSDSFLATASYILSLAGLIRVTRGLRGRPLVRQTGSKG